MIRFAWLATILALNFVPISFGRDEAKGQKHNTLTADEISEGWLLLFDGESTFGWKVNGEATVKNGVLILGGTKETTAEVTTYFAGGTINYQMSWTGQRSPTVTTGPLSGSSKGDKPGEFGSINSTFFLKGLPPCTPLEVTVPAGSTALFRNVKFKHPANTSLFNGKDLKGWKVFPGDKYKSKFEVTKEGWMNVKDGPGDLQTEKTYADFLLRLECISNGKHLNSGIFFRCLPDQYQQGYEAQIRNQWMGDDRTKPVDFGTGAIYRRQAARKVVSNDGEWFSMTIVAHGKHFSTFVNGYQVVDWTDDRPEAANARQGAFTGQGHISIQGHDPTTDLSFRRIYISDWTLDKKN